MRIIDAQFLAISSWVTEFEPSDHFEISLHFLKFPRRFRDKTFPKNKQPSKDWKRGMNTMYIKKTDFLEKNSTLSNLQEKNKCSLSSEFLEQLVIGAFLITRTQLEKLDQ